MSLEEIFCYDRISKARYTVIIDVSGVVALGPVPAGRYSFRNYLDVLDLGILPIGRVDMMR